jgi:hypothetical protein
MLVAPLQRAGANANMRIGVVHTMGEMPPNAPVEELPFDKGDRVCWIESAGGPVHVITDQLVIMSMGVPIAYEPAVDLRRGDNNGAERQPAAAADGAA